MNGSRLLTSKLRSGATAINRKMSANKFLGMATSAIWKAT